MFPELDAWQESMTNSFDERQLLALRTVPTGYERAASEDYERIACLRLFDLVLFDVVKKDVVAASGAVEKVIDVFTHVRSALSMTAYCHHQLNLCTAIGLDPRQGQGMDCEPPSFASAECQARKELQHD